MNDMYWIGGNGFPFAISSNGIGNRTEQLNDVIEANKGYKGH